MYTHIHTYIYINMYRQLPCTCRILARFRRRIVVAASVHRMRCHQCEGDSPSLAKSLNYNMYMYMCMRVYIYAYIHTYIHIYISSYIYTHIYKYAHKYIYIYMYTQAHIYISICADRYLALVVSWLDFVGASLRRHQFTERVLV